MTTKRELAILEAAFSAEISAAVEGGIRVIQPRGKLPEKMVEDGLLLKSTVTTGGRLPISITGYELTHTGRMLYCMQCEDEEQAASPRRTGDAMTDPDRELLEAAAKAAGLDGTWSRTIGGWPCLVQETGHLWQPLHDDGDSARLEAAIPMHVAWNPARETVSVGLGDTCCTEPWGADRQAARRRAGVRAAAAIGAQR